MWRSTITHAHPQPQASSCVPHVQVPSTLQKESSHFAENRSSHSSRSTAVTFFREDNLGLFRIWVFFVASVFTSSSVHSCDHTKSKWFCVRRTGMNGFWWMLHVKCLWDLNKSEYLFGVWRKMHFCQLSKEMSHAALILYRMNRIFFVLNREIPKDWHRIHRQLLVSFNGAPSDDAS